jgi:hypothetical protein
VPLKSASLQKLPKSAAINANSAQGQQPTTPLKPTTTNMPSPSFAPVHHNHNDEQPIITIDREGDRVSRIRIQCHCGQYIELACVY